MSRVHLLPKGDHIAPMPEPIKGEIGRKLPGGFCPRGMRTQWSNLAGAHARGRSKPDAHATPKWREIDRELRAGKRTYETEV